MNDYLDMHPPTDLESDPIYVLGTHDLEEVLIDMMARFGGETPETALIERIFFFDPDFDLVWKTQFEPQFTGARGTTAQNAMVWGLLTLFAPHTEWCEDDDFETYQHAFMRWQYVTRTLLRFEEALEPEVPWLYGWAMLGVELCGGVRAPRLVLWDRRVAKAASPCPIDAEVGKVYADELPLSIEEFQALNGIGGATIRRVERELIEMLLEPERYAPTLAELGIELESDTAIQR